MRPRLDTATSLAYLEKSAPTLEDVVQLHYARGIRSFLIVPLFFAAGRHLLTDIPLLIESLSSRFSDIDISLGEAVGQDKAFWDFLVTKLNDS